MAVLQQLRSSFAGIPDELRLCYFDVLHTAAFFTLSLSLKKRVECVLPLML